MRNHTSRRGRLTRGIATLALLSLMLGSYCEDNDNTPVCVPETVQSCICFTGAAGEQTCQEDGLSYGLCSCLPGMPDAGMPDAATPDAATTDAAADSM